MSNPKVFISYSRSNIEKQELVLRIAKDLLESGVDVILDLWDLEPDEDAAEFAKKSLAEADKIVILSDENYLSDAEKNESLKISKETYEKYESKKFALAAIEKDEEGNPFVPEFYKSGVFVDLSEDEIYSKGFEKLLRWIFNKPLLTKPEIGESPEFLDEGGKTLGTHHVFKKALEAVKNHHSTVEGRLDDYLMTFTKNLQRFRITEAQEEMGRAVYESIESLNPYRNEFVRLIIALAAYDPDLKYEKRIHQFIEEMLSLAIPSRYESVPHHWALDNFLFLTHELFLYTIAVFLKYERFDEANFLFEKKYYIPGESRYGRDEMINFDNIHRHLESLEKFSEKHDPEQEAPRGVLLKKRCAGSGIDFRYIIQADFTIYLRAELFYHPYYSQWYAETLYFLKSPHSVLELYKRARSEKYFDRMKSILDVRTPADITPLIVSYEKEKRELPRGLKAESPGRLMGYKTLASED